MLWSEPYWVSDEELVNKSRLITALVNLNYLQAHFLKKLHFFSIGISCLKLIVVADTRSLMIAYIKKLNIRICIGKEKNTKSLYKCTVIADTNVADTVMPSPETGPPLSKE